MTRAVLADSTPLYAIADDSDQHHERALKELSLLIHEKRQIFVAYPILLEAYTLILFRLGRNAAVNWLAQITAAAFVNPIPDDYRQALAQVRDLSDQAVTLVDATVAAIARRLGMQMWTYDYHFDVMRVPVWR